MWVGERFVIAEIKGLSLNSRHLRVKVKALTSANVPEKKEKIVVRQTLLIIITF